MNIFVTRYINKRKKINYISSIIHRTEEEATEFSEEICDRWNDGTTFEIIEYTSLQKK